MKNKILRYVGVGVACSVVLIVGIVSFSNSDSTPSSSVPIPVVTAIATTTMPTTAKITNAASSLKASTTTYSVRLKTSGCLGDRALPDSACTPGAVLPVTAAQICVSGYTASVRDVPDSLKKQVFLEYGISYDLHANYEVDHLISLELGGSNDISNLFPESYLIEYGARTKDKLENYLHRQVCSGAMTLEEAQYEISHNWLKYFDQSGLSKASPSAVQSTTTSPASVNTSVQSRPAYYTSSYTTSKYYYPASCSAWKTLSQANLLSYGSLEALLSAYPSRVLSPQCK